MMPNLPCEFASDEPLLHCLRAAFQLKDDDCYHYRTEGASVTLHDVSKALDSKNKFCYFGANGRIDIKDRDIAAYTDIFQSHTSTPALLKAFYHDAKKGSARQICAQYQLDRRYVTDDLSSCLSKRKKHDNLYLLLWTKACLELGFLGPLPDAQYSSPAAAKQSHPLLPVFMHHFGCGIPTWEAISLIMAVSRRQYILDMGCGNGYWTWLLREQGAKVVAVDDGSSSWRTVWIEDIKKIDAIHFLRTSQHDQSTLLLVYPIVGQHLTKNILESFCGDTVCIVGTQNDNRYTAFPDMTLEQYFSSKPDWRMLARVTLPSFPGKDDALYIYTKGLVS